MESYKIVLELSWACMRTLRVISYFIHVIITGDLFQEKYPYNIGSLVQLTEDLVGLKGG